MSALRLKTVIQETATARSVAVRNDRAVAIGPIRVTTLSRQELVDQLIRHVFERTKTTHVVTANAQFYVLAERDARFRRRVFESARRVAAFKKKSRELKRRPPAPSPQKVSRLSTQLWEFSEQVRLQTLSILAVAGTRR